MQLNNFDTAAAMESAGWTIDTSDTNAWQEDSSYIGYRGSPSAGISLTLTGYGTLELTFGNGNAAATDTVEVLLDSVRTPQPAVRIRKRLFQSTLHMRTYCRSGIMVIQLSW